MLIKEVRNALIGKEITISFLTIQPSMSYIEECITAKGIIKKVSKQGKMYVIYGEVPALKEDKLQLLGQFTREAIASLINGTTLHNKYQDKVIVHKLSE